ncbi:hypothetical protein [Nostoc sp. UHCC 0870]|uniref:hypothetical protein n=1 Tax=Nostoc sp. UHCC 0870 TaxID=2914041 RepID=UPI001EE01FC4|nr:hypothetical protein [Nostoc sp. UHCC 0870]UKO98001.1 hypothetical protein L6494_26205 [Nostoc sp. UHCC 0870]
MVYNDFSYPESLYTELQLLTVLKYKNHGYGKNLACPRSQFKSTIGNIKQLDSTKRLPIVRLCAKSWSGSIATKLNHVTSSLAKCDRPRPPPQP